MADAYPTAHLIAHKIAHHGWRIADLAKDSELVAAIQLLLRPKECEHTNPVDLLITFEPILDQAIAALGANPRSHAAHLLIGRHPDSCGRLRKHRREAAARAMDLVVEYFIKHHEPRLIDDLAVEIYRLTRFGGDEQVS